MTPGDVSRQARTVARAEAVGSLIRDPRLTSQIEKIFEGRHTFVRPLVLDSRGEEIAELNRLADEVVRGLVQRQIDAGLDVVTDGEVRRATFVSSFSDSVSGLGEPTERTTEPVVTAAILVDRVRKSYGPAAEETAFLRAITGGFPFKITIPAPSYVLTDFVTVDGEHYETHAAYLEDVVQTTQGIVAEIIAAGARWIQFDFPVYPALVAQKTSHLGSMLEGAKSEGETVDTLLEKGLAADAAVVASIPDDVAVALHLCRGNIPGGGFWDGSLAPIAERMFNELPHNRFLFEWEDVAREGDFAPIRNVPKDRVMAMGMISTKTPTLEDEDEVVRKINEAATYLDISQLALTTQCGFASIFGDRLVSAEEAQWRKLDLIGRVADRVWGTD